jgi:hypothetical protein
MKPTEHRWIHAIWCDDIRHELGNKPSLMGVYTGDLVMPTLPAMLPRLAVFVGAWTPKSQPFKQLKIRIEKCDGEHSLAVIEIPPEQLEEMNAQMLSQAMAPPDVENKEHGALGMNFIVQMGATPITETTQWFKVWVDTESETLESFKLRISTSTTSQQHPTPESLQ